MTLKTFKVLDAINREGLDISLKGSRQAATINHFINN